MEDRRRLRIDLGAVLGILGVLVAVVSLGVSIVAVVKTSRLSERQLRQEQAIADRDLPHVTAVFFLERIDHRSGTADTAFTPGGRPPVMDDFVAGKTFMLTAVLTNTGKTAANVTWWSVISAGQTSMGREWPTTPTVRFGVRLGPPPIRLAPFSEQVIGIDLSEIVRATRTPHRWRSISPEYLRMRVWIAGVPKVVGDVPFKLENVPPNFGR